MSVGWRDLLAEEIENEPVLWDFNHSDYYRKDRKNEAWDRICNRLAIWVAIVVQELKKEWKSMRDAHNRGTRPQSRSAARACGFAARPIHGMCQNLSFLNTAHVSGPRMINITGKDDDIDLINENDPPSPALRERQKDEWTKKPPLGPSSSKNVEDSRRGGGGGAMRNREVNLLFHGRRKSSQNRLQRIRGAPKKQPSPKPLMQLRAAWQNCPLTMNLCTSVRA